MRQRIVYAFFISTVLFLLLMGKLMNLQVYQAHELAQQALQQRIQAVPLDLGRGEILDRSRRPLTDTHLSYSVIIFPDQIKDQATMVQSLSELLNLEQTQLRQQLVVHDRPFKLVSGITADLAKQINELSMPGVIGAAERLRYDDHALASHVIGYVNSSDNVGMSGIEAAFDHVLRGSDTAWAAALVDASQKIIPGLGYKRVAPMGDYQPCNVVLTIDRAIQDSVEKIANRSIAKGAVVVMQPGGDILAMCSRPNFTANHLSRYLNDQDAPLLNRAIVGYPPGSVFKIVVAAAALEEQLVKPGDHFYDQGYVDINGVTFRSWDYDRGPRGMISFKEAMAWSSNPVFIEVGQRLGSKRLLHYVHQLGFGHNTAIGLDHEMPGSVPLLSELHPADLANISIGQGTLEVTPLQMASLMATVVNDGQIVHPRLIKQIMSFDLAAEVKNYPPSVGRQLLSHRTVVELRAMLEEVVKNGTGQAADVDRYGAAGKTGSAETGRHHADGAGINHAWFAGYFPARNPQYIIVVLVEDGMSGGDVAAPIFREIAQILPH